MVAAWAISGDQKADDLLPELCNVLDRLYAHNINVVSYACDGTESERSIQRKIIS
jgi:hypothetical protein